MTRLIILAAIILAALYVVTRHSRAHFDGLPFDDGPPVLWIDENMGEPWAVIATGPGWRA